MARTKTTFARSKTNGIVSQIPYRSHVGLPKIQPERHISQGEELTFTILLSDLCNFTIGL